MTFRESQTVELKASLGRLNWAENFVLRNIRKQAEVNPDTGRRESRYEVPFRAIWEAIANAVAHRDYRLASTIDVAIFDDRIEICSPGELPRGMTLEQLHLPYRSVLRNSTLAELSYLTRYIECWGTGIQNMKEWMEGHGLPEPEFAITEHSVLTVLKRPAEKSMPQISREHPAGTWQVPSKYPASTQQVKILKFCKILFLSKEIQKHLGLKDREHFRSEILKPVIDGGYIAMTMPGKLTSSKQKYRLTEKGRQLLKELEGKK